ncbi:MAG TPA: valine--tRNA ligase [Syntrophorhabdaceae bacterium]|nr:valine--tRNA ligase [Syntrophorhabdaceae bacterium]HNT68605.1 valine--tRNA ligase [Syntrophorhabdaceae bacterium]
MMDKIYNPHAIEERWYKFWVEKGFFTAEGRSPKPSFSMVIPPPNVTGSLHMGHALNNTLQDIVTRFRRMAGSNALWLPGTDHAGIATQNVVERELAKEGKTRETLGREAFIERVWQWKEQSGNTIIEQLKRLGCSCDWSRERFTMDEGLSRAVREVFVRLYNEGLIYRDNYIINWCPRCKTALSDLEAEHEETNGHLYHIRYPLAEGKGYLTVATTRPETMLGDTAVAVNPDDERYGKYVGKQVILPIMEKKIPVIGDSYVDTSFGTGVLKVTPAHDLNDFEIMKRHRLEVVKVIDDDGKMNENAVHYKGTDRFECREKIVRELDEKGLLEKIEPYNLGVGKCYRCKTIVEPSLSLQWFLKMKPLAQPAIEAVRSHRVRIIPEMWEKVYFEWMENIRDWCISRQIWWGHRIPVWYCDRCNKTYVSVDNIDTCQDCKEKLRQESDVLDTWFSSGLWPFTTLGWPDNTDDLKTFYPTSLLITGFDILFFWVARMIMMGLKFMGDVPFRDVYIHALVRDAEGKKMSKSKGNVIDPLVIMDRYGTDSFRFILTLLAAQGRDVLLSEERIEGARNFVNKVWNASKLALTFLQDSETAPETKRSSYLPDVWIRSRAQKVIREVTESINSYRFNEAASSLYSFIWHEFCDWYLELIKPNLYGKVTTFDAGATRSVLYRTLTDIMKLLHPIMPFVTEEVYQRLPGRDAESVMTSAFPVFNEAELDEESETNMATIMGVVDVVRNIRGETGIAPNVKIGVVIRANGQQQLLKAYEFYMKELARIKDILFLDGNAPEHSAVGVYKGIEVFVPIEGLIDVQKELGRIEKELVKIHEDSEKISAKLNNPAFREKAPPEVIAKNEASFNELQEKREKLAASKKMLESITG